MRRGILISSIHDLSNGIADIFGILKQERIYSGLHGRWPRRVLLFTISPTQRTAPGPRDFSLTMRTGQKVKKLKGPMLPFQNVD